MYSPEIYRATAKSVLRERSMSTLCYRLNLVVSLGDVASGEHCDPVSSVDVTCHNVPRMPRVERAITLPVHQTVQMFLYICFRNILSIPSCNYRVHPRYYSTTCDH